MTCRVVDDENEAIECQRTANVEQLRRERKRPTIRNSSGIQHCRVDVIIEMLFLLHAIS